jgi:hypothetical protein
MKKRQGRGTMPRELAILLCMLISLTFVMTGCKMTEDDDDDSSSTTTTTTTIDAGYASSADYWTVNSGSLSVSDKVVTVTSPSEGIAIQLKDSVWSTLSTTYGTEFYVQAIIKPTAFGSGSNKNFGVASNIGYETADSATANFYYAGVNYNGRCQLGTKVTPKGAQFGSLISDTKLLGSSSTLPDQYWTIRYEYDDGVITGYINGIQFNKSGTTSYTIPTAQVSTGSVGVYTNGDSFEMASFTVGSLTKDAVAIKIATSNTEIGTMLENATKYVFLPDFSYTTTTDDTATTFTVSALDGARAATTWTYKNSTDSVATVSLSDSVLTVTPVAVGTDTIVITNAADTDCTRTITVTVAAAATYTDTDYGSYTAFYPSPAATGIYEDDHLSIEFDDTPTVNAGYIYIYNTDGDLVDYLSTTTSNTNTLSDGTNKETLALYGYNVQLTDKTLNIVPHSTAFQVGKTYYVVIPNGVITGTVNGKTFTGFTADAKRWSFTTRASKPANTTALTVDCDGTNTSADYRTVQGALCATTGTATITVEPGTYREIIFYKKGYKVTITGDTTATYGSDVIISGINCNSWNGSTATRPAFYWSGSDLVLENITVQNTFDRNVYGTAQSEAIYFDSASNKLIAYNCSFKGHQDTILTKGKNWFYKCYVEGDTDFIWGYADVCLLEECELVQLNTASDTVPTSGSYIFETRVSSDASSTTTVGKGYVVYNSTVVSKHPSSYLARRASAAGSSGSNYYDQVAFVNSTFTTSGSGAISSDLWGYNGSSGNAPVYITKDTNSNMNVGWKAYGCSGFTNLTSPAYCGTITDTVYNAEYDGRAVILNRVYKKTGKYINASDVWDYSSYETAFSATTDSSTFDSSAVDVDGANGTYDILSLGMAATGASSYSQGTALTDGTSSDGYVSWANLLYHSSGYGVYTSAAANSVITLTLAGPSVVTWTSSSYSNGTVTVTESAGSSTLVNAQSTTTATDKTSEGFIYTGSAATTATLTFSKASTYINNIVVSVLDDETNAVSAVKVSGSTTLVVGNSTTLAATVTRAYLSTDKTVTWSSGDTGIATVDSSTGAVTAVAAGTVSITATSVATPSVSGSMSVTVTASESVPVSGTTYTYTLTGGVGNPYSSSDGFLYVSASGDNGGHGLIMKNGSYFTIKALSGATITLSVCKYDSANTVTVTNSSGTTLGTISLTTNSTDTATVSYQYTGSSTDTLTFTYGNATDYLHGIEVAD